MAKPLTKPARFEMRLDTEDKKAFQELCKAEGTTMAEAIQAYIKEVLGKNN